MASCSPPSRTLRAAQARSPSAILDRGCARRLGMVRPGRRNGPFQPNQETSQVGRAVPHGKGSAVASTHAKRRGGNFTQRRTSMNGQDDLHQSHPINRRAFVSMVAAGAASTLFQPAAAVAQSAPKARNVVLVHGLFADGSCWSEVIARLQAAGLNVTAVQNPLTTLPEAVASAERVLARQDGPTVLVGHSFS